MIDNYFAVENQLTRAQCSHVQSDVPAICIKCAMRILAPVIAGSYDEGYEAGEDAGYEKGRDAGYAAGYEDGRWDAEEIISLERDECHQCCCEDD